MLFSNRLGAVAVAFGGAVSAFQFDGPLATPINKRFDANGWTPIPTSKPKPLLELFRRQEDPAFCGYLTGDPESAVSCSAGSSCMYDEVYNWFGCCTGTSITDCNVWTACVESRSIDKCLSQTECYEDPLITACTEAQYPFCATLVTEVSGTSYGHFVCGKSDTSYEVLPTAVGVSSFFVPDTTEDFLTGTDEPTFTRLRSRTTTTDDSEGTSTEESSTPTRAPRTTTTATDGSASSTGAPPPANTAANAPSSVSTAAAMRTAEAMLGAAGGLAGMLAYLL